MSITAKKETLAYRVEGVGGHGITLPEVFLANAEGPVDGPRLKRAFTAALDRADVENSEKLDRWEFDQVCYSVWCDLGIWGRAQDQEGAQVIAL